MARPLRWPARQPLVRRMATLCEQNGVRRRVARRASRASRSPRVVTLRVPDRPCDSDFLASNKLASGRSGRFATACRCCGRTPLNTDANPLQHAVRHHMKRGLQSLTRGEWLEIGEHAATDELGDRPFVAATIAGRVL